MNFLASYLTASRSRFRLPRTLTLASWTGLCTDAGTFDCAAWWSTTSGLNSWKTASSASSRMSHWYSLTAGSRFARFPADKSSTTATSWFWALRPSTRCEPMNPAPPVTRIRTKRLWALVGGESGPLGRCVHGIQRQLFAGQLGGGTHEVAEQRVRPVGPALQLGMELRSQHEGMVGQFGDLYPARVGGSEERRG